MSKNRLINDFPRLRKRINGIRNTPRCKRNGKFGEFAERLMVDTQTHNRIATTKGNVQM